MDQAVLAAQTNPFPKPGDLVKGIVLHKAKNKCLVDLCDGQAVGIISGKETNDSINTFKGIQEGDTISSVVVEDENDEGFFVLSIRKAAQNTAWDRFDEMSKSGEVFSVKAEEANKGGLLLEIDSIKGFLPVSQLAPLHYPRVNEANSQEILRRLQRLIGIKFNVKIIAIDREAGKLILSERAAEEGERGKRLQKLKVGDSVTGKISGIVKFGLFVAFDGLEGLVHISEIAWGHVRNPADYGKLGDEVKVQVIGLEGEKISLSMKRLQEDPWVDAAKKYEVGQKVKGKINRLTSFGAFVTLEKDINGLIHLSEISHEKIENIDKHLKVGEEIEAQIINVDLDDHRIGMSIKSLTAPPPEVSYQAMASGAEPAADSEPTTV
ncbi:MAG: S1 RNA-binding domain-containing protein [bacterium]|nr:S1 RNA-binding domain-containing protein [bacterium]